MSLGTRWQYMAFSGDVGFRFFEGFAGFGADRRNSARGLGFGVPGKVSWGCFAVSAGKAWVTRLPPKEGRSHEPASMLSNKHGSPPPHKIFSAPRFGLVQIEGPLPLPSASRCAQGRVEGDLSESPYLEILEYELLSDLRVYSFRNGSTSVQHVEDLSGSWWVL